MTELLLKNDPKPLDVVAVDLPMLDGSTRWYHGKCAIHEGHLTFEDDSEVGIFTREAWRMVIVNSGWSRDDLPYCYSCGFQLQGESLK